MLLLLHCSSRYCSLHCFSCCCSLRCSSCVVPLGLFFTSCRSSHYSFSFVVFPLVLLLLSHSSFCLVTPFTLSLFSCYSFCIVVCFKYLLAQLLLIFSCCRCCSFHVDALFYLVSMVLPLPFKLSKNIHILFL